MNAAVRPGPINPIFLDGAAGSIFAVVYPATTERPTKSAVIYLPPFAEEMNRARRMAALQARALSAAGHTAIVLDLYGCGDSAGNFADGRWDIWLGDVRATIQWLTEDGYQRISLLGLRLGALLALEVANDRATAIHRVVLWQPILRGDHMVTQFLRLRMAADLAGSQAISGGTATMRSSLASGKAVEVAGYALAAPLAESLDKLRLMELGAFCSAPIDWVEIVTSPDQPLAPAQQQIVTRWQSQQVRAVLHKAVGQPFWALQETTLAPCLISLTTQLFEQPVL